MRTHTLIVTVFTLFGASFLLSPSLPAQPTGPDPDRVAAIDALEFMVGTWEGEGWIQRGPDSRQTMRSHEVVERRLDGTLLLVEGTHRARLTEDAEPTTVHHALAIISPDSDGGYRFTSWLANRDGGDFSGELVDGAFVWKIPSPRGEIRYTIRLDDAGRWFEVGEIQAEDGSWRQFFEMTLSRVGD